MPNIFDYIAWRGDITFDRDSLNCVDALILSRVSYFPFDDLWKSSEDNIVTIEDIWHRFSDKENKAEHEIKTLMPPDRDFFKVISLCARFKNLHLSRYRNIIDENAQEQFSAVTISFNDWSFISYRGTDDTLIGWKEDFNMGVSMPVPSQLSAVEYLEEVARSAKKDLYTGGHSKGGNLAVYASLFCSPDVQRKLIGIYNNDGPGFDSHTVSCSAFREIENRVFTFVPQSSIVGMLLNHEESYTVVHSTQTGIMQHDLYSWEVLGKDFVRLNSVTNGSRFIDLTLKDWIADMTVEQRSQLVDAMYAIATSTNAKSVSELREEFLHNSKMILHTFENTDADTKVLILKALTRLIRSAAKNISIIVPDNESLTVTKNVLI